jgi:hypothetical protein
LAAGRLLYFLGGLSKLGFDLVVFGGQVVGFGLDVLYVCVVLLFKLGEVFCFSFARSLCWSLSVLKFGEVVRDSLHLFDKLLSLFLALEHLIL